MSPFQIATGMLVLGGVAGLTYVLWPWLRPGEPESGRPEGNPEAGSDASQRHEALLQMMISEDDSDRPIVERTELLPDEPEPVPWDIAPVDVLPVLSDGTRAVVLPVAAALLHIEGAPDVVHGRKGGRAIHAVRVAGDTYLDLVEAVRVVPTVCSQLLSDADLLSQPLQLLDAESLAASADPEQTTVIAPWMMRMGGSRIVPEGTGEAEWTLQIGGHPLHVRAWVPAMSAGIVAGRAAWAAICTYRGIEDAGATPVSTLELLSADAAAVRAKSLESWRWSRRALGEIAAIAQYLESQGVPHGDFIEDVFAAHHTAPIPGPDDDSLIVIAAVLNWRAVMARRHGLPRRAIAVLDAALELSDDEDNRADVLYNRGYARLQLLMATAPETIGPGDLRTASFDRHPDPAALEPALADFEAASRLNPEDAHAWSQMAMIHQLRGERAKAAELWLQAATRTKNPEEQAQLLANAEALS